MSHAGDSLEGCQILVTRPIDKARILSQLLITYGGTPVLAPLIEIQYLADSPDLRTSLQRLDACDVAVFVSIHAVKSMLTALATAGKTAASTFASVKVAAIGPATAQLLAENAILVDYTPSGKANSEGLLQQLTASVVGGCNVVIYRGQAGRPLLAQVLSNRQANVRQVQCYQRRLVGDHKPLQLAAWLAARRRIATLTSVEIVDALIDTVGAGNLRLLLATPLAVFSRRIEAHCRTLGFHQAIEVASQTTPAALLEAVVKCAASAG